jgi:hypothetical protein
VKTVRCPVIIVTASASAHGTRHTTVVVSGGTMALAGISTIRRGTDSLSRQFPSTAVLSKFRINFGLLNITVNVLLAMALFRSSMAQIAPRTLQFRLDCRCAVKEEQLNSVGTA